MPSASFFLHFRIHSVQDWRTHILLFLHDIVLSLMAIQMSNICFITLCQTQWQSICAVGFSFYCIFMLEQLNQFQFVPSFLFKNRNIIMSKRQVCGKVKQKRYYLHYNRTMRQRGTSALVFTKSVAHLSILPYPLASTEPVSTYQSQKSTG